MKHDINTGAGAEEAIRAAFEIGLLAVAHGQPRLPESKFIREFSRMTGLVRYTNGHARILHSAYGVPFRMLAHNVLCASLRPGQTAGLEAAL